MGVVLPQSGRGFKNSRALRAQLYHWNPPSGNPGSATGCYTVLFPEMTQSSNVQAGPIVGGVLGGLISLILILIIVVVAVVLTVRCLDRRGKEHIQGNKIISDLCDDNSQL